MTTGEAVRVRLADLPGRPCSIAAALELVGDRWALLAVREVILGNHRFSDIVRGTGAPRDRLSARLTALVEAGVLERRPYSTAPPRSGYHLTRAGRELVPVLQSLLLWGERWAADEPAIRLHHTTGTHGEHAVDGLWSCRTCGEPIAGARPILTPAGRTLLGLPTKEDDDGR